jgi:hypothetical protein
LPAPAQELWLTAGGTHWQQLFDTTVPPQWSRQTILTKHSMIAQAPPLPPADLPPAALVPPPPAALLPAELVPPALPVPALVPPVLAPAELVLPAVAPPALAPAAALPP